MGEHARELNAPGLDELELEPGAAPPASEPGAAPGPGPTPAAPPAPPMFDKEDARFFVDAGLTFIGAQLGVAYSNETREEGAKRLAAVLLKYADRLPLWLLKYREEFMLGSWFAGLMFKTWELHRAAQAKASTAGPAGGGSSAGAAQPAGAPSAPASA